MCERVVQETLKVLRNFCLYLLISEIYCIASDPSWCHWNFSLTYSFRSHYGPGVDSASNRNEYQEYFPGGKGDRCVRLITLSPSRSVVTKSGNLNFLEPSGPLRACNGTALPLPLPLLYYTLLYFTV